MLLARPKYSSPVAPISFCAFIVKKPINNAGIKNRIFSIISLKEKGRLRRISIQKSETGKITAAGFDKSDKTKKSKVIQYSFFEPVSIYLVNVMCPARKKS